MSVNKPGALMYTAGMVVLLAAVPLLFVVGNSLELSLARWQGLWSSRLPGLLWNTLALAALVAIGSLLLGVSTAWLVARRRFPGRTLALWLMVLPLTVPTYVFAHIYTTLLERDGWLGRAWQGLFGDSLPIPELYNLGGAALVLTLASFSYIFLLTHSALGLSKQNLEEAARIQGASKWQVLWHVNLPMLRPALAAGVALVVLHVVSDFGAVSMLRFQTFTLSIYLQMTGRFDYQAAAALALILILLSLGFLILERLFRRRQRYYGSSQARPLVPKPARRGELLLIWCWLGTIALLAFVLPLAWIVSLSWEAWHHDLIGAEFWSYTRNSLWVAFLGAGIAVLAALPVALYHARRHSPLSNSMIQLSSVGFVLPGPVIALGILAFVIALSDLTQTLSGGQWSGVFYNTLFALVLAVVIRFLPLAVQSQEAALQQLTPSIEQAGRVLGAGPIENLWRVTLPMIRGGLVSAWVLVFIDTLKELPATLILRPTGFDTLPVRIWIEASEEMLELAAPAALMLVLGTLPALWIVMGGRLKQA